MTGLIRAELRKLRTTQVWLWLLIGAFALTALAVVGTILTDDPDGVLPSLATAPGQRNLFAQSSAAAIFVCVLGIIGITGEYRHLTVTPTYLSAPRRNRVVLAKLITYGLVGVAYAVACALLLIAMSLPWLAVKDISVSLTANRIPLVLLAAMVSVTIYGIVGVGLGALIRNQVAAVTITLAYLFLLEPILSVIPWVDDHIYKYLPGAAASALTQVTTEGGDLLEPWQGGVVLVGYGLVFALLAARLTIRRDVS